MSRRERDRMTILIGIKRQELTLVQATELMDVSYRQSKRVWRGGIGPTATPGWCMPVAGRPSLRRKAPELRAGWPATTSAPGTSIRRWPPSIWRWTTLSRKRLNRRRSRAGRRNPACRNAGAVSFDPIHFVPARSRRSQRRRRTGEGESFAAPLKIYTTGLAGRSSAKPETSESCFLSCPSSLRFDAIAPGPKAKAEGRG